MTTTVNYSWALPTVGASVNTWGTLLNAIIDDIDAKMFARTGGAISGNVSVAGVVSVGSAGTGATTSDINLDGSSAANCGPMMRFKRNGVTVGYLGTGSAVLGGSSDDLVLYRTTGGSSATLSPTGLAVVGTLAATAANTATLSLTTSGTLSTTGSNWISFRDTVERGYVGYGTGNSKFTISNTVGPVEIASIGGSCWLDAYGNFLAGAAGGSSHVLKKASSEGNPVLEAGSSTTGYRSALFYTVAAEGWTGSATALYVGKNSSNGRSINAGGTVNQSGADYAEYERNNGTKFGKGQVVGFKEDGTLTDVYADAIRFGVKSTNPGLVGGDSWGSEKQIGKRPDEPLFNPTEYKGPQDPGDAPIEPALQTLADDASAEDKAKAPEDFARAHAAWVTASADYEKLAYEYRAAQADHSARVEVAKNLFDTATYPEYQRALKAFEARLETNRQAVDRIAYCGKVPVAVYDATPGGYIIADKDSDGKIIGKFLADPDFAQYKKAIGRVNRIMDAEASAHLVEAINGTDPALFVGMAELAVIIH